MRLVGRMGCVAVALAAAATGAWAQASGDGAGSPGAQQERHAEAAVRANREGSYAIQTFYLANVNQQSEVNEITTALRNLLDPTDKVYYVPSQNAIFVGASADQLVLARKLLNDLDRPKKTYRLTYTVTDMDAGKVIGTQHFALIVVSGDRTATKQGSKVPVATGSYDAGSSRTQTQMTYIDIGMNISASLDESSEGLRLRTRVERISVVEDRANAAADDPIFRQTSLEGTANLVQGKPLVLGSLDVPGSTRSAEVSVVSEVVR